MMSENSDSRPQASPQANSAERNAVAAHNAGGRALERKTEHAWREIRHWISARPWPVVLFLGLFVIAAIAWYTEPCEEHPVLNKALPLTILVWVALLFAWFTMCFTGDPYENRTRAIEFAYFFMVLSFSLVAVMIADMGKAKKFGVVEGCVENLDQNNVSQIQCDYPIRAQWRVGIVDVSKKDSSVGGTVAPLAAQPGATTPKPAPSDEAAKAAAAQQLAARLERNGVPTHADLLANYQQNRNYHFLLNIGGRAVALNPETPGPDGKLTKEQDSRECKSPVAIRGGLPVPVYFIVLALIGGAISLAKNVPGIQKRSDDGWQSTVAEPRLSPGEVRELLLFQVLQFVSAPLLAVAAYHTIKPESFGTTVAIGFLVGFGSDQILASIRSMVKAGQPIGSAQQTTGRVIGTVTQGAVAIANAAVMLVGTTLTTKTDDKGKFTLAKVAFKDEPYMLKVSADGKTKEVSVTVNDAAPVKVDVDLA